MRAVEHTPVPTDAAGALRGVPQWLHPVAVHPYVRRSEAITQFGGHVSHVPAWHNRWLHGAGACACVTQWVQHLSAAKPCVPLTRAWQGRVQAAALLHDVGHIPGGHVMDNVWLPALRGGAVQGEWWTDHEQRSVCVLTRVWPLLRRCAAAAGVPGLSTGGDAALCAALIVGQHAAVPPCAWWAVDLLHSDRMLDCDRADYLQRDTTALLGGAAGWRVRQQVHTLMMCTRVQWCTRRGERGTTVCPSGSSGKAAAVCLLTLRAVQLTALFDTHAAQRRREANTPAALQVLRACTERGGPPGANSPVHGLLQLGDTDFEAALKGGTPLRAAAAALLHQMDHAVAHLRLRSGDSSTRPTWVHMARGALVEVRRCAVVPQWGAPPPHQTRRAAPPSQHTAEMAFAASGPIPSCRGVPGHHTFWGTSDEVDVACALMHNAQAVVVVMQDEPGEDGDTCLLRVRSAATDSNTPGLCTCITLPVAPHAATSEKLMEACRRCPQRTLILPGAGDTPHACEGEVPSWWPLDPPGAQPQERPQQSAHSTTAVSAPHHVNHDGEQG